MCISASASFEKSFKEGVEIRFKLFVYSLFAAVPLVSSLRLTWSKARDTLTVGLASDDYSLASALRIIHIHRFLYRLHNKGSTKQRRNGVTST